MFGAFDIECTNWDEFVCGAILTPEGETRVYWSEVDCFRALADYEGELWTWAGGRYDMVWAFSLAKLLGVPCEARLSGGGIVSMAIGNCTLRDGYRLYPVPLAIASEFAGLAKLETGFDCICGTDCGGYCAINKRMSLVQRSRLAEYLAGDLRATAGVVQSLHEFADCHGIELRSTVGASAWATLKAMGAPKSEWRSVRDYMFARGGYYGGRTEIYQVHATEVYSYDINSAYPAALRDYTVPTGGYRRVQGQIASQAFEGGKPGIFAARVFVPEMYVPCLPNRGIDRLLFVYGSQLGSWTGVELRAAIGLGCRVEQITEALVWDREEKACAEFMAKFWGLRAHYGKKTPQGAWLKWFVNSLTGKLAMRPEGEILRANPKPSEIKGCPGGKWCLGMLCRTGGAGGSCCEHACTGACMRWTAIDPFATIFSAPTFSLPDCGHVHWSASLTGQTRIELGAQLRHADRAAVLCDTDCVKATRTLSRRLGKELGEWNFEGRRVDHFGPFPKAYRNADPETGEYETKAKGVPEIDAIRFDNWALKGAGVKLDRGVWGIKGGARKGQVFQRKDITRHVRSDGKTVGSRVLLPGGETRPMSLSEYKKRTEKERMEG